jgi:hypothetical protein
MLFTRVIPYCFLTKTQTWHLHSWHQCFSDMTSTFMTSVFFRHDIYINDMCISDMTSIFMTSAFLRLDICYTPIIERVCLRHPSVDEMVSFDIMWNTLMSCEILWCRQWRCHVWKTMRGITPCLKNWPGDFDLCPMTLKINRVPDSFKD